MALQVGIRKSRVICSFTRPLKPYSSQFNHNQVIASQSFNHGNNNGNTNDGSTQGMNWKQACKFGAAVGLTAFALHSPLTTTDLEEQEQDKTNNGQEVITKENR